jgi:hypothetical protein
MCWVRRLIRYSKSPAAVVAADRQSDAISPKRSCVAALAEAQFTA